MNHDHEWKLLAHYWNHLTPRQRNTLIFKAHLYRLERRFCVAILWLFVIVCWLTVPVPRKLRTKTAHWL